MCCASNLGVVSGASDGRTDRRAFRGWSATSASLFLALVVFLLAWLSPVDYGDTDAGMMLLAAQAILDHGSTDLTSYAGSPRLAYSLDPVANVRIEERGGGLRYHNVGAPWLALPAVWLANRLGWHMLHQDEELALQNLLSALSCAAIALLLYALGRQLVSSEVALLLAAVFVLGSSLISTLGTALWTSHFTVLVGLLTLLLLLRSDLDHRRSPHYVLLAVGLLIATLCRPASVFLGAGLLAHAAARHRRLGLLAVVAGAALIGMALLPFLAPLFESWPPYYSPLKLLPATPLHLGLVGILASPSRGLFVFSPFLLAVVVAAVAAGRRLRSWPIFWCAVSWISVHALFVAVKEAWWGGHSFGPRLLVEVLPAFAVLTFLVWRESQGRWRRVLGIGLPILAVPAVVVHSGVGLFDPWTRTWNEVPNVDAEHDLLWSWRYPQILASEELLDRRMTELQGRHLETYRLGEVVGPDSRSALFVRWYESEGAWRWSRGEWAELRLRLAEVDRNRRYRLRLEATSVDPQRVTVTVNGTEVGSVSADSAALRSSTLELDGSLLQPNEENVLRFVTPRARSTEDDERLLGIALWSLSLMPVENASPAPRGGRGG